MLEQQRIGPVEQHEVDLAARVEPLQVGDQPSLIGERGRHALEERRQIDIAVRAEMPRDGGSKLHQQQDAVCPRNLVEPLMSHAGIILLGRHSSIETR